MTTNRTKFVLMMPLLALCLCLMLVVMARTVSAVGEAPMVHTENVQNVLVSTKVITATPVPDALSSAAVRVDGYTSADIFVTAAFSGTGVLTATVQFAADTSNYVDAYYTWAGNSSLTTQTYVLTFNANGTKYVSLPVRGQNMRIKFTPGGLTASENVQPTVRAVLKN